MNGIISLHSYSGFTILRSTYNDSKTHKGARKKKVNRAGSSAFYVGAATIRLRMLNFGWRPPANDMVAQPPRNGSDWLPRELAH